MSKRILLILSCLVFGFTSISAQRSYNYGNDWDDWDWDDDFDEWFDFSRPLIEFNYGFGEPKHDQFISKFAQTGLMEIKLGYSSIDSEYRDLIVDINERYFFGSKVSDKLHSDNAQSNEISTELYRFGFGRREGYGYVIGPTALIPYFQTAFVWSKLNNVAGDFPKTGVLLFDGKSNDERIVERYLGNFRFGTLAEGGAKFEIAGVASLNASYEASVIFPRHLVWKHLGSMIIEAAGIWALDEFVDEIMDRSPAAGPIVNFLLKNGFTYGFYLLKKENMNWPFETEAPLTYETFKVGMTFTF